jgi:hypothetical protein
MKFLLLTLSFWKDKMVSEDILVASVSCLSSLNLILSVSRFKVGKFNFTQVMKEKAKKVFIAWTFKGNEQESNLR